MEKNQDLFLSSQKTNDTLNETTTDGSNVGSVKQHQFTYEYESYILKLEP